MSDSVNGFALVEALIGTVLLTLAGMALLTFSSNVTNLQNVARSAAEYGDDVQSVSQLFATETSCRLALGGPDSFNGPLSAYTQTITSTGLSNIKIYHPTTPRTLFMDPASAAYNTFGRWTLTTLEIKPVGLAVFTPPGPIPAKVHIIMTDASGRQRETNNIYLSVMLNGANQIVSCFGLTYGTDGNPAPLCPTNWAFSSTGTRVGCVQITCPSPKVANGYDPATGSVICQ